MTGSLDIGDTIPWVTLATTREKALPVAELAGGPLVIVACRSGTLADELAKPGISDPGFWLILEPDDRPDGDRPDGGGSTEIESAPGRRVVPDPTGAVRATLRLPDGDGTVSVIAGGGLRVRRVLRHPATAAAGTIAADISAALREVAASPPPAAAPALILPDVLEPALRRRLIETWESEGNEETGYLRGGADGELVHVVDRSRKRRRDHFLDEASELARAVHVRVRDRVLPWIQRAFHFRVGFAERYRVACYGAENSGFFAPHRDMNEASGYRHFAMSIALNDEYEGGALRFPEFGGASHVPNAGAAIVYSGVLMHEVTPITSGRRFVLVNFLTSREGAEEVARYQARHGAATKQITRG
jgi:hypothetical protein